MCVIAFYKKGLPLNENELLSCFTYNGDGAGCMWQGGGKIRIKKGFMNWVSFWEFAQKLPTNVDRVFHFRIATSGRVSSACCHPFPVCGNYKEMARATSTCNLAVAHNGVLGKFAPKNGMRANISDTMVFVKEVLAPLGTLISKKSVQKLIELYTDSRFAIMSKSHTWLLGVWQESIESGAFYSNVSYTYGMYNNSGFHDLDNDRWYKGNIPIEIEEQVLDCVYDNYGLWADDIVESENGTLYRFINGYADTYAPYPSIMTAVIGKKKYDFKKL